jgi:hypothetical protein
MQPLSVRWNSKSEFAYANAVISTPLNPATTQLCQTPVNATTSPSVPVAEFVQAFI